MDNHRTTTSLLLLLAACSAFLVAGAAGGVVDDRPKKLFVFGDSYADTGNLGKLDRSLTRCWYEPYGMTFPGHAAGRFSDGKVLPDFIASFLGIRSPVPYKFRRRVSPGLLQTGMNFAVSGTGVFDLGNFQRNLSAQVDTFQSQIEGNVYPANDLNSSVALVMISGNDYQHFLDARRRMTASNTLLNSKMWGYIANVTAGIRSELKRIGELGVKKVVVTNLSPLGCTPYVTRSNGYNKCDKTNESEVAAHNKKLDEAVWWLGEDFLVLDLHSAFMSIINKDGSSAGSKFESILRPCCEGKTESSNCGQVDGKGEEQYTVCGDAGEFLYWDSLHPTQAGWEAVFRQIKPWLASHLV